MQFASWKMWDILLEQFTEAFRKFCNLWLPRKYLWSPMFSIDRIYRMPCFTKRHQMRDLSSWGWSWKCNASFHHFDLSSSAVDVWSDIYSRFNISKQKATCIHGPLCFVSLVTNICLEEVPPRGRFEISWDSVISHSKIGKLSDESFLCLVK